MNAKEEIVSTLNMLHWIELYWISCQSGSPLDPITLTNRVVHAEWIPIRTWQISLWTVHQILLIAEKHELPC
jgi:hypothetical protein